MNNRGTFLFLTDLAGKPRNIDAVLSVPLALLLLLNGSCTDSRPILGQAYVAPATLHLRSELSAKSKVVVDLKHGDALQILDVQRRFVLVRTHKGVEGWADSLQLMSADQMDRLTQRRREEAALPPEGSATAYEILNVHIDPDRQSPPFAQIPEGGAVTILGHKITPKNTTSRAPSLVISRPQTLSHKQRKEQQNRASFRLPPRPRAPKPPANWRQLSAERIDGRNDADDPETSSKPPVKTAPQPETPKPPVLEDWMLIRTKNNEIGWVLSRNLLMSIPDEVAQYAEGKRITAFFDLGVVNDDVKGQKHNWLWTTAARAISFDFDSWRVFLWNARRHRYETSFRKREVEGYFPVRVEPSDAGSPLRTFHLITKDEDGKRRRRGYTFDGHLVHLASTEEDGGNLELEVTNAATLNTKEIATKAGKTGWFKREWLNLKHRLSGK